MQYFFFLVVNRLYFLGLKGELKGFFTCPDQSSSFLISPETTHESLTSENKARPGFWEQPRAPVIHQLLHKTCHNFRVTNLQTQKMLFKYFALEHTCKVQGRTNMLLTIQNIKALFKTTKNIYLLKWFQCGAGWLVAAKPFLSVDVLAFKSLTHRESCWIPEESYLSFW